MQNETEGVKELLLTYEQSIERKDEVIANLTRAMQRQRDKFEMSKTFCEWKIRHNDKKREVCHSCSHELLSLRGEGAYSI